MIQVRKAAERGHFNHGWLDTYPHVFLRRLLRSGPHGLSRPCASSTKTACSPARGSACTAIATWRSSPTSSKGRWQHSDSLGNGSMLRAGELQRMTAGTGIRHSEFNPSDSEPVHLYQIWLLPAQNGLEPGYEQKDFSQSARPNAWRLVASPDAADGSLAIHQDGASTLPRSTQIARLTWCWRRVVSAGCKCCAAQSISMARRCMPATARC